MGNANERDYFIRFSVDDTPDLTPPEVVFTSIDSGSYIMYGVDELALSVYTNELASCSWSVNDEDYTFMTNIMSCPNTGFEQSSAYFGTYECSTTLEGVSADELNYFYFRCIDEQGNVNEESYQYITKQTENDLEIISVSPEGDVSGTNVSLEIETTGGVENGEAVCSYYVEDVSFESMIEMAETNGSVHSQDLDLSEGDYTFYVGCQDTAGNQDYNYTEISLEFDYYGPSIESIYVDLAYSVLFIEVDEESNCEYASESFTYGEGTSMTGVDSTEHEASLESLYYYVICEDLANNQASYEVDISAWT
jgi:hypothetical protein